MHHEARSAGTILIFATAGFHLAHGVPFAPRFLGFGVFGHLASHLSVEIYPRHLRRIKLGFGMFQASESESSIVVSRSPLRLTGV